MSQNRIPFAAFFEPTPPGTSKGPDAQLFDRVFGESWTQGEVAQRRRSLAHLILRLWARPEEGRCSHLSVALLRLVAKLHPDAPVRLGLQQLIDEIDICIRAGIEDARRRGQPDHAHPESTEALVRLVVLHGLMFASHAPEVAKAMILSTPEGQERFNTLARAFDEILASCEEPPAGA